MTSKTRLTTRFVVQEGLAAVEASPFTYERSGALCADVNRHMSVISSIRSTRRSSRAGRHIFVAKGLDRLGGASVYVHHLPSRKH